MTVMTTNIDFRRSTVPPEHRELHVEEWGDGRRVVLVHGSLSLGAEEWDVQRPLAHAGFRLLVPDRRGYGSSPQADGEDFMRDAHDIAALMEDGAHLVGHSYGGVGALLAAARRPEATLSLTLLEPSAFWLGRGEPAGCDLVNGVRAMWNTDLPDLEWVVGFLKAVGSDPDLFPPEFLDVALPLVPIIRRGRPMWHSEVPLDAVAAASYPKVIVSGGHSAGFDAICDDLARRIGAHRAVIEGAGHEIQFAVPSVNELLLRCWGATP
jgi:pimeloyl-ACP methyl ester carboxylesterase